MLERVRPFQLAPGYRGGLIATESDLGQITRVNPRTGETTAKVTGVPGAAGAIRFGRLFAIVTGEADIEEPADPGSSVLLARAGKAPRQFADLMQYELDKNPEGQIQFDENGEPLDALSNPFNIVGDRTGKGLFIVADAGANVVLRIGRHGKVSTLFRPPVVRRGECAERPNNTIDGFGCDPVPTGLAYAPGGKLYVSTLGAEAPGAGRVDSPNGIAVSPRGTVRVPRFVYNVI